MTLNGIDVSSYQSTTYPTAGIGFVMVKATEGTSYVNPRHADQIAHGRATSLVVGHYHFVRPGSMSAQVSYFLQHAAAKAGDILALDWEDTGVPSGDKDTFIKDLQAAAPHNRVLLYCNRDFWLNRDHSSFAGDGLWIADPDAPAGRPRIQHAWVFHQYSEAGGIDHDVAQFADAAALREWAAKGAPRPAPPKYEPFPGAAFFMNGKQPAIGKTSPIFTAMGKRLVAKGFGRFYKVGPGPKLGEADVQAYQAYQRSIGYSGAAATWPPGPTSWNKLQVPNT